MMANVSALFIFLTFSVVIIVVQLEEELWQKPTRVEILVLVERRLADEFDSADSIRSYFCRLFGEVRKPFAQLSEKYKLNLTIELAPVRVNKNLFRQRYFELKLWEYRGELFYLPDAEYKMEKSLNGSVLIRTFDVVILFTRLKRAYPSSTGRPVFAVGPAMLRNHYINKIPSMAILNPSAGLVANELAYLLNCTQPGNEASSEASRDMDIPLEEVSKCDVSGMREFLGTDEAECYRKMRYQYSEECGLEWN